MDLKRVFSGEGGETAGDVLRVVATVTFLHAMIGKTFGPQVQSQEVCAAAVTHARDMANELVRQLEANP
jgi:hypothetical protein